MIIIIIIAIKYKISLWERKYIKYKIYKIYFFVPT